MKAIHLVLNETEHATLPFTQLAYDDVDPDLRAEMFVLAGVDKYTASVALGQLSKPWRDAPAGALVLRHLNSGGYNISVFNVDEDGAEIKAPAPASTSTTPPAADPSKVAADVAAIEAKRAEQVQKDEKAKKDAAAAANDNKETPAPATTVTTTTGS